jgi:hypothetical protein
VLFVVVPCELTILPASLTLADGWTRRFASSIPVLGY